jgi:phage shock protein PspC (stress-responsive transcriptional regulator)
MQAAPPSSNTRTLRRNPKRGRIAGLCAGLSENLDVDVFWIRLAVVLSVFISFSTTFWIYLILWLVIPRREETPLPPVSFRLWWTLKRIQRQVNRAHRRLPPDLADEIQTVFDLVKVLAPHFDDSRLLTADHASIQAVALQRFPALIRQFMLIPTRRTATTDSLHERLRHELQRLAQVLRTGLDDIPGWGSRPEGGSGSSVGVGQARWRTALTPLRNRLEGRIGPETRARLDDLETQLIFLLEREPAPAGFDPDLLEIRKIADEYLPDALNQYLRLPADRARQQRLADGRTAEEALHDQLVVLSSRLGEQARTAFEQEARGLMVHGRFLQEKFAPLDAVGQSASVQADSEGRRPGNGGQGHSQNQQRAEEINLSFNWQAGTGSSDRLSSENQYGDVER